MTTDSTDQKPGELEAALSELLKLRKNCEGDIGWRGKPTAIVDNIRVRHILLIEKSIELSTDLLERLARAERERDSAVAFANKVERGDMKFAAQIDAITQEIAETMSPHKTIHENLAQTVKRILTERDAALTRVRELEAKATT